MARRLLVFSAFVVALFTEMHGYPLTIYLLSGPLGGVVPGVDLSHNSGHLWTDLIGWKGDPHVSPFHLASYVFIFGGFWLIYAGWKVLFAAIKAGVSCIDADKAGYPAYYDWRTRSGCYFCFFQRRIEWVGLLERHPDLYELAMGYEKIDDEADERYTWTQRESLEELARPERVQEIKDRHEREMEKGKRRRINLPLVEVFDEVLDDEDDDQPCFFCHT